MRSQGKLFEYICQRLAVDAEIADEINEPYICDDTEAMLLETFVDKVAIWLDLYSPIPLFSDLVARVSVIESSGILRNCIFACSALYLHGSDPEAYDAGFCLKYHNAALQQLRINLASSERENPKLLLCSLILVVEGLFFGESQTFMHHIIGSWALLLEILDSNAVSGKKYGYLFTQACFYTLTGVDFAFMTRFGVMPVMDLQTSEFGCFSSANGLEARRLHDECQMLTSDHRVDFAIADESFLASRDKTWWLQESLFVLWESFRLRHIPYVESEEDVIGGFLAQKWLNLWQKIEDFEAMIPAKFAPLVYNSPASSPSSGEALVEGDASSSSNKPMRMEIYFLIEQAAVIYMNMRYAKILLLESINRTGLIPTGHKKFKTVRRTKRGTRRLYAGPVLRPDDELLDHSERRQFQVQYAKEILGIAESYGSDSLVSVLCVGFVRHASRLLNRHSKRRES
ncbi:unnamed protein product [Kuraishia capsulata CBS 1993]|uniref:Transcription factor domain-containing protein n=1 Tax=Kuraishia capsulata CBS 1993 TaxID=1382522 RepID=W6MPW2_9ASCO|nr:uncharacterized protein KUCA_T00003210001 [Kuraishia capsulata CBS 1993]CDK27232.1 unnamed protein product [Kuraishia capsulata CBS 1993]